MSSPTMVWLRGMPRPVEVETDDIERLAEELRQNNALRDQLLRVSLGRRPGDETAGEPA